MSYSVTISVIGIICKIPLADNNNSERFYQLMAQVIPDWEKIKKQLDGRANRFLSIKVEF